MFTTCSHVIANWPITGEALTRVVVNDLRVQELRRRDGRFGYTIVGPDGSVHALADGFLRGLDAGTARTYAYLLVDHLRWLGPGGAVAGDRVFP